MKLSMLNANVKLRVKTSQKFGRIFAHLAHSVTSCPIVFLKSHTLK